MNSCRFVFLGAVIGLAACDATPPDDSPRWVRVARDANYTVFIDTGRLRSEEARMGNDPSSHWGRSVEVWYRTDHAIPRVHDGDKKLFNREVVHSILDCDSLQFRVAGVDMSMRGERVFVQQRLTPKELQYQRWRHVEMGTAEEMAARAACHFAGAKAGSSR